MEGGGSGAPVMNFLIVFNKKSIRKWMARIRSARDESCKSYIGLYKAIGLQTKDTTCYVVVGKFLWFPINSLIVFNEKSIRKWRGGDPDRPG
jgi:hypothetical protein